MRDKGLVIDRRLGHTREIAIALFQIANILLAMQRYGAADVRYQEALQEALQADDLDLQGDILQYQGILQYHLDNYDQAVGLYQQAMKLYQEAYDQGGEMRTSTRPCKTSTISLVSCSLETR
jgi:tetratricopeptide (TPR) repeat protein